MKKNKKAAKGKQNNKKKKPSRLLPIISRLMPYILAVLFVVMLFTIVGQLAFSNVLYGLFSTYAPVFILTFLLYHSLMWYYDINRKICTRRVCCSVVIVLSVSMIQHLISLKDTSWIYRASEGIAVSKPTISSFTRPASRALAVELSVAVFAECSSPLSVMGLLLP